MFLRLLLLFTLLPFVELWLMLRVSEQLGLLATLVMVIGTGILGATLAKRQGAQAWHAIRRESAEGRLPAAMLLDGLLIFIAGVLLISPGVLTDLAGLALLVPPVRWGVRVRLAAFMKNRVAVRVQSFGQSFRTATPAEPQWPDIIDVGQAASPSAPSADAEARARLEEKKQGETSDPTR